VALELRRAPLQPSNSGLYWICDMSPQTHCLVPNGTSPLPTAGVLCIYRSNLRESILVSWPYENVPNSLVTMTLRTPATRPFNYFNAGTTNKRVVKKYRDQVVPFEHRRMLTGFCFTSRHWGHRISHVESGNVPVSRDCSRKYCNVLPVMPILGRTNRIRRLEQTPHAWITSETLVLLRLLPFMFLLPR